MSLGGTELMGLQSSQIILWIQGNINKTPAIAFCPYNEISEKS